MDYEEEVAREILKTAHERTQAGEEHPRPFIQPLGSMPDTSWSALISNALTGGNIPNGCFERTFYRRRLMDVLGIPVTRRWLRRQ